MALAGNIYTVEEAIEQFGFGPFQVLVTVFCGMLWVSYTEPTMIFILTISILVKYWTLGNNVWVGRMELQSVGV